MPTSLAFTRLPLGPGAGPSGASVGLGHERRVSPDRGQANDEEDLALGHFRLAGVAALFGAFLLSASAHAAPSAELNEVMSYDGLQKTSVKGVELAYTRPGATLASYKGILLLPVEVSFYKNWDPNVPGTPWKLSASDRDTIKQRAAKLVYDSFVKELKRGGYPVVSAARPDVLLVKISILNLIVTAPDVMSAGMDATYARSPGQATILAELFDSETGQVLARVVDTQQPQGFGGMMTSGSNMAAGQQVADQWARILRNGLDRAREVGAMPVAATTTP